MARCFWGRGRVGESRVPVTTRNSSYIVEETALNSWEERAVFILFIKDKSTQLLFERASYIDQKVYFVRIY
jgi:hypothetical protein